jgi:hypothetical protein
MSQTALKSPRRIVRPAGVKPINVSMPQEAVALLHAYAPTKKSHGLYLASLLFQERARREERQRLLADQ